MNSIIDNIDKRTNIVICGPAGSGKTVILNKIKEILPHAVSYDDQKITDLTEVIMSHKGVNLFTARSFLDMKPVIRHNIDLWVFTCGVEIEKFIASGHISSVARDQARNLIHVFDQPYQHLCYIRRFDAFFI